MAVAIILVAGALTLPLAFDHQMADAKKKKSSKKYKGSSSSSKSTKKAEIEAIGGHQFAVKQHVNLVLIFPFHKRKTFCLPIRYHMKHHQYRCCQKSFHVLHLIFKNVAFRHHFLCLFIKCYFQPGMNSGVCHDRCD